MLARFLGLEIPHLNHTIAATAQEARAALQHFHCAHIKLDISSILMCVCVCVCVCGVCVCVEDMYPPLRKTCDPSAFCATFGASRPICLSARSGRCTCSAVSPDDTSWRGALRVCAVACAECTYLRAGGG
jgi:hypothetical protein